MRHPHTHTHTRQRANRKLLPLPRRRRHRFAALSLARRSAPPQLPRSPKLPHDEIWLGLPHRYCHCCCRHRRRRHSWRSPRSTRIHSRRPRRSQRSRRSFRPRSLGSHSRGAPLALGGSAVLLGHDGDDAAQLTHAHRFLDDSRTLRAAAARGGRREHHAQLGTAHCARPSQSPNAYRSDL